RALAAVVRPYARAVAGEPLRMRFDRRRRVFEFTFRHDPHLSAPTELFVPDYQYPGGYTVTISDGAYEVAPETQTLVYRHTLERETHTVRIQPRAR
ncbi:MAG: putative glycosidase, partial [Anaerolineales bacterium]|nr:putative glycosidase [Anaerolineales bacterium]